MRASLIDCKGEKETGLFSIEDVVVNPLFG